MTAKQKGSPNYPGYIAGIRDKSTTNSTVMTVDGYRTYILQYMGFSQCPHPCSYISNYIQGTKVCKHTWGLQGQLYTNHQMALGIYVLVVIQMGGICKI